MNDFEPSGPLGRSAVVHYSDDKNAFLGIAARGALLELVTFGFYRFWLTTEIRRHLWGHTMVDGDALEYTGRGKELFLGFLIALAVLTPLFLVSSLLGLVGGVAGLFIKPLFSVFYFFFWQYAVYRARRYRLTRTVWRGVRFWMTGSGWNYAIRAVLWAVLSVVTLGFAYPWRMAALERYKMGHTLYGTLEGRFVATGLDLFKQVWWVWLLGLICASFLFLSPVIAVAMWSLHLDHSFVANVLSASHPIIGLVLLIGLPFLHARRMALEWRWWAEGIRFGGLEIACELPASRLVGLYWGLIGVSALVIVGFGVIGWIAFAMLGLGTGITLATAAHPPILAIVLGAVWYLALLLALGVVSRCFLTEKIWDRVVCACWLRNNAALADVRAAGVPVSAFGEGLADGLDFAGF